MKPLLTIIALCPVVLLLFHDGALAQAENVPVQNPVYIFLKRMEVKGLIEKYHDVVLPLSRREVAAFLVDLEKQREHLSDAEQGYLREYVSEFTFDISGSTEDFHSLIESPGESFSDALGQIVAPREKFLYFFADSNMSFFGQGLLTIEGRRISGDALGSQHTEFAQFGGRFRGTLFKNLGYFIEGTNAQFSGSRELLQRDRQISQSYALYTLNSKNFDFVEGYVRYDARIASVQVGRERVLWGTGYDQKMIASDNVRVYDFIRADVQYKSLKYTFLHAWLLGKRTLLEYTLPSDPSTTFIEPVVADKYFAAHRIGLSFPRLFEIGFQEMAIYSNRSPDLAYLNPITLIESAQRSREERDNILWAFDIQTHFLKNVELTGTFILDDLNLPDLGKDIWTNRYAYQLGLFYADPFTIPNTSLMLEYTRVEPYTFSHTRSRENDYGSLGAPLGARIGPNADSWFVRADVLPARNLMLSFRVARVRHGMNVVDPSGFLIRNVGGDLLQPHRPTDPDQKMFLDGILVKTTTAELLLSYELVNQIWLDGAFLVESVKRESDGSKNNNTTFFGRLRIEL